MTEQPGQIPKWAQWLGYTGLLPQAAALTLIAIDSAWVSVAAACALAYAALIFSFLGGVWWGGAIQSRDTRAWPYLVAVAPSLIAMALMVPWKMGWGWPSAQLAILGVLLAGSSAIDQALGYGSKPWMTLRRNLSAGLGTLTFAIGLMA